MRGAHRNAPEDRHDQGGRGSRLGTETIDRPQLNNSLSHGFHDSPAAKQGPQAHGDVAGQNNLGRHFFGLGEQIPFFTR